MSESNFLFEEFEPGYRDLWQIAEDDRTAEHPCYFMVTMHGVEKEFMLGDRNCTDDGLYAYVLTDRIMDTQDTLKNYVQVPDFTTKSLYFGYNLAHMLLRGSNVEVPEDSANFFSELADMELPWQDTRDLVCRDKSALAVLVRAGSLQIVKKGLAETGLKPGEYQDITDLVASAAGLAVVHANRRAEDLFSQAHAQGQPR
jgi:hypothetical protein